MSSVKELWKRGRKTIHEFECSEDRLEYDRQPNESDRQWLGFLIYRDLSAGRTIKKAAEKYAEQLDLKTKPVSVETTLQRWSSSNGWRKRCTAWDRALDKHRRELQLKEIEKMHERHTKLAIMAQSAAGLELQKWLKKIQSADEEKIFIDFEKVARVLELAVRLEKSSRGEPEQIIENRVVDDPSIIRAKMKHVIQSEDALVMLEEIIQVGESEKVGT